MHAKASSRPREDLPFLTSCTSPSGAPISSSSSLPTPPSSPANSSQMAKQGPSGSQSSRAQLTRVHTSSRKANVAFVASKSGHDTRSTPRSEEHTSELQSLTNLVCRLLLENRRAHV